MANTVRAVDMEQVTLTLGRGRDALHVLDGVDLGVARGEFVALVGPSGCGKSTLLEVAAGLQPVDGGRVLVEGGAPRVGAAALMPQGDALLPWRTVAQNVAVGARLGGGADAGRIAELLGRFGLTGFAEHYPHALSGGMRQRVALARTVLSGRTVWLLDEPFAALDALTRAELHRDLARLCAAHSPAVLMVTHDTEEAVLLADRVVVCGPRPMGALTEIAVEVPHPRTPAAVAPVRERVLEALGVEVVA